MFSSDALGVKLGHRRVSHGLLWSISSKSFLLTLSARNCNVGLQTPEVSPQACLLGLQSRIPKRRSAMEQGLLREEANRAMKATEAWSNANIAAILRYACSRILIYLVILRLTSSCSRMRTHPKDLHLPTFSSQIVSLPVPMQTVPQEWQGTSG